MKSSISRGVLEISYHCHLNSRNDLIFNYNKFDIKLLDNYFEGIGKRMLKQTVISLYGKEAWKDVFNDDGDINWPYEVSNNE